tara:strand:- start:44 stop:307 length:264 start_codon:yes stop_codon:yes gene_type:complete
MKYNEDLEQDWEPVVLKKQKVTKPKIEEETPFNRLLINARQSAKMTQHQLAQSLNIKLNDLEMYEQGKVIPEKRIISRMNKILGCRL